MYAQARWSKLPGTSTRGAAVTATGLLGRPADGGPVDVRPSALEQALWYIHAWGGRDRD
jgi:hypothetical protein